MGQNEHQASSVWQTQLAISCNETLLNRAQEVAMPLVECALKGLAYINLPMIEIPKPMKAALPRNEELLHI